MQAYEFSLWLNHKGELIIPDEAVNCLERRIRNKKGR